MAGVVKDQARMLDAHGYDYDILVNSTFNEARLEWAAKENIKTRNVLTWQHYRRLDKKDMASPDFYVQSEAMFSGDSNGMGYKEAVEPYDVVITHDLIFLDTHLCCTGAIWKCIGEYPEKKWLHWIHSCPSARPKPDEMCFPTTLRYKCPERSKIVFLNEAQKKEVAKMYATKVSNVRIVNNAKDVRDFFEFSPETCEFIEAKDLLNHSLLQTFSFSTPRWESKGVDRVLKIFGIWKSYGLNVKLVLVNCHCTKDEDRKMIEDLKSFAVDTCGLEPEKDFVFTSEYSEDWRYSVPHKVLKDLTIMSNMFIFPSHMESCSLVQAEANITGKFVVLNRDFPPMLDFSLDTVMNFEFTKYNPVDHPHYYEFVAREIIDGYKRDLTIHNATVSQNTTHNRDFIFKKQLEPIFYEDF